MSDTAIPIPSSDPHALGASSRRRAAVKRLAWLLAPWALPALLFTLWSVGSARG
ncbi:ABC transporter permease, partial [Burkholderia territorii]